MTLAIFLPILFACIALLEVRVFKHWHAEGMITQTNARVMTAATLALPPIVYVVLNFMLPDVGAIEIF